MIQQLQVELQTASIRNVPLQIYDSDFSFVVNGEEFKTSKLISDLLSPKISNIHRSDPTNNIFIINTRSQGNFARILNLLSFSNQVIPESEIEFFSEVIQILGNSSIQINNAQQDTPITEENVFSLLHQHEKLGLLFEHQFESEIDFIASHFFSLYENHEEEILNLSLDTLEQIVSNSNLRLKDEDQLVSMINKKYKNDASSCILYNHVFFQNVESSAIDEFLSVFDFNNMSVEMWSSISKRLRMVVKHENDEDFGERYTQKKNVKEFKVKNETTFDGILKYLRDETGNSIQNKVNITASNVNSSYPPSNVVIFEDQSKDFRVDNGTNPWICFEFKENRIIPTNYQIRSYSSGKGNCHPKSWVVEGSNDNSNWETLDTQTNCSVLNGSNISHLFSVNNLSTKEFRYVRMKLTDIAWCSSHHLEINSFELYGKLI